jgi:hypothetical protein
VTAEALLLQQRVGQNATASRSQSPCSSASTSLASSSIVIVQIGDRGLLLSSLP